MKFLKWVWSWFGGPAAPAPELVVQAQAKTVELCGFLPQASTVISILGALTGQGVKVATALGAATTICKAIKDAKLTPKPVGLLSADAAAVAEIDGVPIVIEGTFVK